jgi:small-conductance mechanosensitive channel
MLRRSVSLSLLPRMHRAIASHGPLQLQQGRKCRELPVRPMLLQATTNQDSNAEPPHGEPNAVATASAAASGRVEGLQGLDVPHRVVIDLKAKLGEASVAELEEKLEAANSTAANNRKALNQRTAELQSEREAANQSAASVRDASAQRVTELEDRAALYQRTAELQSEREAANQSAASIRDASAQRVTELEDRAALYQRTAELQSERKAANQSVASIRDASAQRVTELEEKLAAVDRSRTGDLQESLDVSRRTITNLLTARATVNHGKARADNCLQKNADVDHRAVTPGTAATNRADVDSIKARRTAWTADWTSGLTFVLWSAALATGAFYTGQRAAETTAATPLTPPRGYA